jgi:hypothetical protein
MSGCCNTDSAAEEYRGCDQAPIQLRRSGARYPSGKGEVCKTFIRRFDSGPRLQGPGEVRHRLPGNDQNPATAASVVEWTATI